MEKSFSPPLFFLKVESFRSEIVKEMGNCSSDLHGAGNHLRSSINPSLRGQKAEREPEREQGLDGCFSESGKGVTLSFTHSSFIQKFYVNLVGT